MCIRTLKAAVVIAFLVFLIEGRALITESRVTATIEDLIEASVTPQEWWDPFYAEVVYPLALNVYHEARGESELGQQMVAYVTVERAKEDQSYWGGNTIHGVVYYDCQFSWTCDPNVGSPANAAAWAAAEAAATQVALGHFEPPAVLADARYYMNPETASQTGRCWMAENLRRVGTVGNHVFYAEGEPWPVPPRFGCNTA